MFLKFWMIPASTFLKKVSFFIYNELSVTQRKAIHAPSGVHSVDAEGFLILVFCVVNKDEYVSFAWELLWTEAKSDTVRFPRSNLQMKKKKNTNTLNNE